MSENTRILRTFHKDEDNEPVCYCKKCLSLNIQGDKDFSFCDDCGSTEIESTDIFKWEDMYNKKYKKTFRNE